MAAGEDVEVEMGNCFAAVASVVDDDSEAVLGKSFLLGDHAHPGQEVTEEILIGGVRFADADDDFLGDEKKVNGSLGRDVFEAEAKLVFVDDVARDFAVGDLLEDGFIGHVGEGYSRTGRDYR